MLNFVPLDLKFTLVDHYGTKVTNRSYEGRWCIVFFGFTHCKVVCPRSLTKISQALDRLGQAADRFQPLYISVDPERDTPERMRSFLADSFPRFIGLTGSQRDVDAARASFRVSATKIDSSDGDYDVPHSALVYILDPLGEYGGHFGSAVDAEEMAEELSSLLRKDRAGEH